jgi:hypothetical protein
MFISNYHHRVAERAYPLIRVSSHYFHLLRSNASIRVAEAVRDMLTALQTEEVFQPARIAEAEA